MAPVRERQAGPVVDVTDIAFPVSGTVKFTHDAMNRPTNLVDGVGTTRYTYDAAGQLSPDRSGPNA